MSPREVVGTFRPEALRFLQRLVAVNSFTLNPGGVDENAALIAAQFAPLGFRAEQIPSRDPRFGHHLFLHRPGRSGRGLMLVSHLDTVYPPEEEQRNDFRWQVEGDRIFGPGVNDIKGGTAMIWLVLTALRKTAPDLFENTHWVIAANAAEEELVPDFPELCRERLPRHCRAALVFEACGGQGRGLTLVQSRKGSANFRVRVQGRGSHAGGKHHEGANAIVELSRVVGKISGLTDYGRDLTANVGWISGGGPVNRVPHFAECEVNIRAFDEAVLQGAVDAMFDLEKEPPSVKAASDGFPCRTSVELFGRNPSWAQNPATDALIGIWRRAGEGMGISLLAEPRGGLSDGNFLSRFLPVLDGLGPFGLNGHASERNADGSKVPEFVLASSFDDMGAVNLAGILELLK